MRKIRKKQRVIKKKKTSQIEGETISHSSISAEHIATSTALVPAVTQKIITPSPSPASSSSHSIGTVSSGPSMTSSATTSAATSKTEMKPLSPLNTLPQIHATMSLQQTKMLVQQAVKINKHESISFQEVSERLENLIPA